MPLAREELIRRYRAISAPTVYDVLDKLGHPNHALHSDIRSLKTGWRLAGPALTVHGKSMTAADGRWGTAFSYDMFRAIQPGDVIVFDCGGHRQGGPWGGNTGANARAKGAAGIVIVPVAKVVAGARTVCQTFASVIEKPLTGVR